MGFIYNKKGYRGAIALSLAILLSIMYELGCGSSSSTTPATLPIAIEGLEGRDDIGTDSNFQYSFESAVDSSTVTSSSFFMVEAACSEANCNPANALPATTSCSSNVCTLDPTNELSCNTVYCICMTTDILDTSGNPLLENNLMTQFTTEACTGAPSVSSLKDAAETTIGSTGTTSVNPTSFAITFNQDMDDNTVTTDNVTMSCVTGSNSALTPTLTIAAAGTANTYTVTVTDAYKYALMTCTLTIGTSVKSAAGDALASAATYQFTNACAVSDGFNADSHSCWSVDASDNVALSGVGYTVWDDWTELLADLITFDTANSALDYSSVVEKMSSRIYKAVEVNSSGFEIIIHLSTASTFENALQGNGDFIGAVLAAELGVTTESKRIEVGIQHGGGSWYCLISYFVSGGTPTAMRYRGDVCTGSNYYFKLSVENSVLTTQYSTDGVTYHDMEGATGTMPTNQDFTDMNYLSLGVLGSLFDIDLGMSVGEFDTTGISVSGQY